MPAANAPLGHRFLRSPPADVIYSLKANVTVTYTKERDLFTTPAAPVEMTTYTNGIIHCVMFVIPTDRREWRNLVLLLIIMNYEL